MAQYLEPPTVASEDFARWMRPHQAVEVLTKQGWATHVAISTLISRLSAEIIIAAAEHAIWKPVRGNPERQTLCVIPSRHWNPNSEWLPEASLWQTGDIYFDITGESGYSVTIYGRVSYFGIRFDPEHVETIVAGSPVSDSEISPPTDDTNAIVGRRQSQRWKPWIAELAAYIHDEGIPEGVGSQGQEELITAIANRLVERGEEPLSRSTVQPTVQAVLNRLRGAEN